MGRGHPPLVGFLPQSEELGSLSDEVEERRQPDAVGPTVELSVLAADAFQVASSRPALEQFQQARLDEQLFVVVAGRRRRRFRWRGGRHAGQAQHLAHEGGVRVVGLLLPRHQVGQVLVTLVGFDPENGLTGLQFQTLHDVRHRLQHLQRIREAHFPIASRASRTPQRNRVHYM